MTIPKIFFAIIILSYPLLVYYGQDQFGPRTLAVGLIAIAVVRLALLRHMGGWAVGLPHTRWTAIALIATGGLVILFNTPGLLKFYPILVNAIMFTIFFVSLYNPPSVIERIARLQTPDLTERGQRYTRSVTKVWCGFFVINGSMALYTCVAADVAFWAVYNGLISYALMGLLFIGEYAVRCYLRPNAAGVI